MEANRLTEAAAAVLLLVISAALLVPKAVEADIHSYQKADYARSELATYKDLLDHFHQDCGRYPTTQEGLRALRFAPPGLKVKWGPQPYTDRQRFADPWGNPYLYTADGQNHFTLKSYGQDGSSVGDGDEADIQVEP